MVVIGLVSATHNFPITSYLRLLNLHLTGAPPPHYPPLPFGDFWVTKTVAHWAYFLRRLWRRRIIVVTFRAFSTCFPLVISDPYRRVYAIIVTRIMRVTRRSRSPRFVRYFLDNVSVPNMPCALLWRINKELCPFTSSYVLHSCRRNVRGGLFSSISLSLNPWAGGIFSIRGSFLWLVKTVRGPLSGGEMAGTYEIPRGGRDKNGPFPWRR